MLLKNAEKGRSQEYNLKMTMIKDELLASLISHEDDTTPEETEEETDDEETDGEEEI